MLFKKKKKNKTPKAQITSMLVNGVDTKCLHMRMFADQDGAQKLDIYTAEPTQELHYDRSELVIKTTEQKKLRLNVAFLSADKDGKYYHYLFLIEDYHEYFA